METGYFQMITKDFGLNFGFQLDVTWFKLHGKCVQNVYFFFFKLWMPIGGSAGEKRRNSIETNSTAKSIKTRLSWLKCASSERWEERKWSCI